MDLVATLKAKTEECEVELAELERQRVALEADIAKVIELLRNYELVLSAEQGKPVEPHKLAQYDLRHLTLREAIHAIALTYGTEGVHVHVIVEQLLSAGFPFKAKQPKRSVTGTICLNLDTYERVGPGTYKLREVHS